MKQSNKKTETDPCDGLILRQGILPFLVQISFSKEDHEIEPLQTEYFHSGQFTTRLRSHYSCSCRWYVVSEYEMQCHPVRDRVLWLTDKGCEEGAEGVVERENNEHA
jgi:hypothetical protein